MAKKFYALYKGDTFIDLGSIAYLAKVRHCSKKTIRCLAAPSIHKQKKDTKNALLVYPYLVEDRKDELLF